MKKLMVIGLVLAAGLAVDAQTYVIRGYKPVTNQLVITNDFAASATPVLVYTYIRGADTTNVVTMQYAPSVATNAADYGQVYNCGQFTTLSTNITAPVRLVTNNVPGLVLARNDQLKFVSAANGSNSTNVFYRVLFQLN